jgi:hypothetical protein
MLLQDTVEQVLTHVPTLVQADLTTEFGSTAHCMWCQQLVVLHPWQASLCFAVQLWLFCMQSQWLLV